MLSAQPFQGQSLQPGITPDVSPHRVAHTSLRRIREPAQFACPLAQVLPRRLMQRPRQTDPKPLQQTRRDLPPPGLGRELHPDQKLQTGPHQSIPSTAVQVRPPPQLPQLGLLPPGDPGQRQRQPPFMVTVLLLVSAGPSNIVVDSNNAVTSPVSGSVEVSGDGRIRAASPRFSHARSRSPTVC